MALSKSPKFHVPYCLQGLPTSCAIWVVELSWSRDVLSAGAQSTPHGLWWTWKVWAPPSLKSICFHRTLLFLPVGVFSWKTSRWKSLSQRWHGACHSALFPFLCFRSISALISWKSALISSSIKDAHYSQCVGRNAEKPSRGLLLFVFII